MPFVEEEVLAVAFLDALAAESFFAAACCSQSFAFAAAFVVDVADLVVAGVEREGAVLPPLAVQHSSRMHFVVEEAISREVLMSAVVKVPAIDSVAVAEVAVVVLSVGPEAVLA